MSLRPTNCRSNAKGWVRRALLLLAVAASAGCTTLPAVREAESRQALRAVPKVPEGHLRADRALLAAFFAANGIRLSPAQVEQLVPPAAPQGRIDRNAIRRIATQSNRLLMVVKADERFLWDQLGHNLPLLILLPPDIRYNPATLPLIPVAWDRKRGHLDLLDGNGEIQTLAEDDFFARRAPLKHAALCLIRPGKLPRFKPTRDQQLLLADFWFDRGFYRRAEAAYSAIQDKAFLATADVDALVGRGNVLVRTGRYGKAIPVFRTALALAPDSPRILNNLAYAMLKGNGELLTALRHASKANQLDPGNPVILETIGSINLQIGDAAAAARYLEQAWARAAKHSPEVQIAIMDQLVRAWNAANRRDLAWQVAQCRQRTFPNYQFPKDILFLFPSLRHARIPADK